MYKIKFIDSYRFMQSELWNLIDNLSRSNNKESKSCMERKKKNTNQNAILLGLKIIDWITDAKNVEENAPS